jgi:hypothetical protein
MTLAKRLVSTATKKNDDRVEDAAQFSGTGTSGAMFAFRGPRKKRILLSLLAILAVYFFIKYLPSDVPPSFYDSRYGLHLPGPPSPLSTEGQEAPPRPEGAMKERYFDGPVKFYHLTESLYRAIDRQNNARNVLFGISRIKSASNVLPIACEMSKRQRNRVHVTVLGRQDVSIDTIKNIYGASDVECPVHWLDARPDYGAYSTDERMEVSVQAALNHILYYLKPHAVITDDPALEDHYFVGAVKEASGQFNVPVITLSAPAVERLGFLSELDGPSLGYWDKLQVNILVHGSATSSASFIRLLKSIENADYTGTAYPRLIIELPEMTDLPTLNFLSEFRWPPGSSEADSKMVIRRRLSSKHLTPVEASLRTIESFYPVHADRNHILFLTPDAELSPSYLGYLKYLLLEYRYSKLAMSSESAARLMGISLESPSRLLNGSSLDLAQVIPDILSPLFLYQAPNTQAALYFGDKWVEFHSFLSHRLSTGLAIASADLTPDAAYQGHPVWLAYLVEFTKARAYYMLYPIVRPGGSPLVTIHTELYQSPIDAFETKSPIGGSTERPSVTDLSGSEVLTGYQEQVPQPEPVIRNTESVLSVLLTAGGNTTLPRLEGLPILSHDAVLVTPETSQQLSISFADQFSLEFGGCKTLQDRAPSSAWMADDLFCDEDTFS